MLEWYIKELKHIFLVHLPWTFPTFSFFPWKSYIFNSLKVTEEGLVGREGRALSERKKGRRLMGFKYG